VTRGNTSIGSPWKNTLTAASKTADPDRIAVKKTAAKPKNLWLKSVVPGLTDARLSDAAVLTAAPASRPLPAAAAVRRMPLISPGFVVDHADGVSVRPPDL
jgi:hypothetical protein